MLPSWWKHSTQSWKALEVCFGSQDIFRYDNWTRLNQGKSHNNYHLAIENQEFFVQVIDHNKQHLLPTKQNPNFLYSILSDSKIKSWLTECIYESNDVRAFSWFNNNHYDRVNGTSYLEELINFLVQLHQLDKKLTKNFAILDIKNHIKNYYQLAITSSPKKHQEIQEIYCEAKNNYREYKPSCLCHNDLGFGNILWNEQQEIRIIDWEYSCITDPVLELASIINHLRLNAVQENFLLSKYQKKMNIKIPDGKLEQMKRINLALNRLWYLAQN